VLGCFYKAAERRVDSLGTAEVGPQIRLDRDQFASLEVCVVPAPGETPEPRGVDLRDLR